MKLADRLWHRATGGVEPGASSHASEEPRRVGPGRDPPEASGVAQNEPDVDRIGVFGVGHLLRRREAPERRPTPG